VLDLTCGLGADALFLSRRFRRVVTLERDATLARIAAENFARLGAGNIEVVCSSAEEYLTQEGLTSTGSTPTPTAVRRKAAGRCGWRRARPTSSRSDRSSAGRRSGCA